MSFRRRDPTANWRAVLDALSVTGAATDRLDALLAAVSAHTGAPAVYLYLADEGGRRFHLERSRAAAGARRAAEAPVEGGAESMAPTPPLELSRGPEWDSERIAPTPAGIVFSTPLRLRDETVGLLQIGPLDREEVPSTWRRRLAEIAFPVAVVAVRAHGEERLQRELGALAARESVGRRLQGSAMELERYVGLLLAMAVAATGVDGGFVAIVDEGLQHLSLRASSGMPDGFAESVDLDPRTGLFDWSAADDGALFLRDVDTVARLGIGSLLAVPLLEAGQPLGIFALASFGRGAPIDLEALELLATFAEQSQQALHNDRLFRSFVGGYLETVQGLARSLDARRPHTHGHHAEVARVAALLGVALSVPPDEVEAIRVAASVHDVGMAGAVSGEESYQADYEHPTVGAGLIEHLPLHPAVVAAIAAHHEWFDGWGFPQGLAGESIPLAGRILAAAEFVVEMAAGDPVRAPWGAERIAAEIRQRRGSQLDPTVADIALELVAAGALLSDGSSGSP